MTSHEVRSPYQILGLAPGATPDEMRAAYRRKALEVHPDRNPGDARAAERFRAVQEAYDELRGRRSLNGAAAQRRRPPHGMESAFDEAELRDLFRDLFDADAPAAVVELTLAEVANGTTRRFSWHGDVPCPECGGTPLFMCAGCYGTGVVARTAQLDVVIPPGMEDGARLRIAVPVRHARPVFIETRIGRDPCFLRRAADLEAVLRIDPAMADSGGIVQIATPAGRRLDIKVPPGTQAGTKLRLQGQGLPQRGVWGDLYLEIEVAWADAPAPKRKRSRRTRVAPRKSRKAA